MAGGVLAIIELYIKSGRFLVKEKSLYFQMKYSEQACK